jgi:glycosyltransferase involved in cell wall biosynthesis
VKIAYLTSVYPDVSHTFILREVRALRARGVEVGTFSVRRACDRNILGGDAQREAASTRWLVPPRVGLLVLAFAWSVATRPVTTGRTLLEVVLKRGMTVGQRVRWLCYAAEAVLLAYWVVTEGFDHLHCHFGNSGSSTGMLAARLADIPFSITCHGSELREIEHHRLREKVARAAFVACVSEHGRAQLMLACRPEDWERIHIVRCGVPQVDVISADQSHGEGRILCVGRLSPEKGHLVLLDALSRLRDQGTRFHCTLVGDGPMRSTIQTRADDLRLTDSLTLTGALDPDRVADHYRSADVVVLASFSEGVPVVLMEALTHSLPVVATRVGGVPELVRDERSGLVVAPGNAGALSLALRRILDEPEWARTLGRNGAEHVRQEFDVDASAHRLVKLFHQAHRLGVPCETAAGIEQTSCPSRLTHLDS